MVQRTFYLANAFSGNVRINFCGFAAFMSKQTLYVTQVRIMLKQVRGKAVPQRMHTDFL